MANIYFESISLKNFMSFKEAYVNLNRNGYILVEGINNNVEDSAKSNGSGKSSLFSGICWCLTGETISGAKEVSNIYLKGKTEVQVKFTFDNHSYTITRTRNPSNLFIEVDGVDKSGKGIRDTQKILEEYLPQVTSSLINSVIILGQGLPQRFTNNTPSGRKEILEKLSNSDFMITDIKEKLSVRKSTLEDSRNFTNGNISELQGSISTLNTLLNMYINNLNDLSSSGDYELQIDKINLNIQKLKEDIESYETAKSETETLLNNCVLSSEKLSSEYKLEQSKLKLIDTKELEDEITSVNFDIKTTSNKISEIDSISDICPMCGQKLHNVVKPDSTSLKENLAVLKERYSELQVSLNESNKYNIELQNSLDLEYADRQKELSTSIEALQADIINYNNSLTTNNSMLISESENLAKLQTKLNELENTKQHLKNEIENTKKCISDNTDKINDLRLTVDDISARLEIISKMNTLVKRDFRGYLLSNIIQFISTKSKYYSNKVFGTDKLDFKLDGNNILISYDDKEYELLSGGEKQKVDVIIQLSIRDMLCKYLGFSSNIIVLDEITDSLDSKGCQNIFNLISSELGDVESIYIISHHTDELNIPCDDTITIIKDNNKISRIA